MGTIYGKHEKIEIHVINYNNTNGRRKTKEFIATYLIPYGIQPEVYLETRFNKDVVMKALQYSTHGVEDIVVSRKISKNYFDKLPNGNKLYKTFIHLDGLSLNEAIEFLLSYPVCIKKCFIFDNKRHIMYTGVKQEVYKIIRDRVIRQYDKEKIRIKVASQLGFDQTFLEEISDVY